MMVSAIKGRWSNSKEIKSIQYLLIFELSKYNTLLMKKTFRDVLAFQNLKQSSILCQEIKEGLYVSSQTRVKFNLKIEV